MKNVSCPRSTAHVLFRRMVIVEGPTTETVDSDLQVVDVRDCTEFRLVRRITGLYCVRCNVQATVRLV